MEDNIIIRQLEECAGRLQVAIDEEQDYLDSMPENLQNSIRAMNSEDFISNMEDALENIEDAITVLKEEQ